MGLDELKEPEFTPADGDYVFAPRFGMSPRVYGVEPDEVLQVRIANNLECLYRVRVDESQGAPVYVFTRDGVTGTPQALNTPDQVFTAFGPSKRFPEAFVLPQALLAFLARHDWVVLTPAEVAKKRSGAQPKALDGSAPVPPVRKPVPLPEPLPGAESELQSTGATVLHPLEVAALQPPPDLSPEQLAVHLAALVTNLEGVTLQRPAHVIVAHDVQRVVNQLLPYAAQIPAALQGRLANVQKDLIGKNNAYDLAVKANRNSARSADMRQQLGEVEAAARAVGELRVRIHDSQASSGLKQWLRFLGN